MERFASIRPLLPFALGLSLAACGANVGNEAASINALGAAEAEEPSVSAETYKGGASANPGVVDVGTAQQALFALTGNIDVLARDFRTAVSSGTAVAADSGSGAGAAQSVDARCAGAGTAAVDGHMNMAPAPVAVDVSLAIAFSGCATLNGTMLDGNIEFSQTLVAGPNATTPMQVETLYVGDVNLSGNVNISCPVDLNVLVDETGRAIQVQGTFCNQDASNLAMQLQPLWEAQ